MTDQPKISPADLAEMSDTRSFDEAWHSENRYGREKLEAENAELRRQLAAATARLEAGVKFHTLSADKGSGIEICKIHAGWSVYITHYGNFGPKDGRLGLFESLNDAWNALVNAGWLPKPEETKGA